MTTTTTTGLPELPKDHFWEVRHTVYDGPAERYKRRTDGSLTVALNRWEPVKESKKPATRSWKNLWTAPAEPVPVERPFKTLYYHVMQDEMFCASYRERLEYIEKGWFHDGSPYVSEYHLLWNWEPTPENILKAALAVLEEFELAEAKKAKDLALKQAQDALVGFYPPKTLEGTIDDSE